MYEYHYTSNNFIGMLFDIDNQAEDIQILKWCFLLH